MYFVKILVFIAKILLVIVYLNQKLKINNVNCFMKQFVFAIDLSNIFLHSVSTLMIYV